MRFQDAGNFEKAAMMFKTVVKLNPRSIIGWQNLGNVNCLLKDNKKAEEAYLTALKFNPDNARSNFLIGSFYNVTRNSSAGKFYLDKAFKTDSTFKKTEYFYKK